ncbi:MAG: FAD-binding oxidoreductase [Burkholderiaceae bacterium]|nr:FAD-binding oxidoreductase [Burkholderiaceae bacterium]
MNETEAGSLLESLRTVFDGRLLTDAHDVEPFLNDWRRRYRGRTLAVAQPTSTAAVAAIVRWCSANRVAVVAQGGNTGMSGAATPDDSGRSLVVSLTQMSAVRAVDTVNNTITVEAGLTLAGVQDAARAADRLFPLSLASEGSCTIGGNLSTNAGGCQVLRYGNARELCLGVEVVTADGEVWNGLRGLRKDNTGYDLRDLFVGAEGTLGIITAATLKLFPQPAARLTALAAVPSPREALALLQIAQLELGSSLTAFELLSDVCLELVAEAFPQCQRPFAEASPSYVLLECSDPESEAHASERFERVMMQAFDAGLATDAVVADSIARSKALWALRENVSAAEAAFGKAIKHDIAVPISAIADFIEATSAAVESRFPGIRMVVFGHLGDGNLHFNVASATRFGSAQDESRFLAMQEDINRVVHDAVAASGGSISAEHGLGVLRRDESARYKSPVELELMRRIKTVLDPLGIMNPGKVLPPSVLG